MHKILTGLLGLLCFCLGGAKLVALSGMAIQGEIDQESLWLAKQVVYMPAFPAC
ncbi:MAG: hypothetical protein ACYTHJ_07495 [Planctomycetota bacterium]|jgi:hypothetical protein